MFDTSNILINWQPVIGICRVKSLCVILRRDISEEVPAGINEGIHRIRFPLCTASAFRARYVYEFINIVKWTLAARLKLNLFR